MQGGFRVAAIGPALDLTYPVEMLGDGGAALNAMARGDHEWAEILRNAEAPMLIVGQGALAREDGARVLGAARAIAEACNLIRPDWNGFNVLHRAAARVGALDIGFVPDSGGKDVAGIVDGCRSGSIELLYLLGADELDFANTGSAFVIYQGHHGDRGAARADVVLPGCAYTEKDATYVNTEGRVQLGRRAVFPPGEAREDWAILRALSGVLGGPLPFDSLHALRQLCAKRTRISRASTRSCRPNGARSARAARWTRRRSSTRSPTTTAPTRSAAPARQWPSAAKPSAGARRQRRGPARMAERLRTERERPVSEFWWGYGWPTAIIAIEVLIVAVPLLLAIAYYTYAERKVLAFSQLRKGPNVVGPFGLLQPIADGLKMLHKETIIPSGANRLVFIAAPMVTFTLALVAWAVIPFDFGVVIADINVGILYLFAISSLSVYGVIMAGWASNSRYAFLGALRAAAQMVSYEVSIGFVLVTVLLCAGSLNLSEIVLAQRTIWFVIPLLPMAVIFFISGLAETNRAPFDLAEGELEIVAGYFVEYSSMSFALFYLGEYGNMILVSAMTAILFLGGWLAPFGIEPFTWVPRRMSGTSLVPAQGRVRHVLHPVGARDLSALPL